MKEKYRYKNENASIIEIEAPKEKADTFIQQYYPNFILIEKIYTVKEDYR